MGKLLKALFILIAGVLGLFVIAAVALLVFFDANDFRDEIAAAVREETGRELTIEGDLEVSIFPWLALEIGRTTLGNAEGFGDEPFLSFDRADLSVRVLPLILSQDIAVGTASLEGFEANLAVAANGVSNWDDLAQRGADDTPAEAPAASDGGRDIGLDIANVRLIDASIDYTDAQSGSSYALSGINVTTGRIAAGAPFDVNGSLEFAAEPDDMGGNLAIGASVTLAEDLQAVTIGGLTVDGELRGVVDEPTQFSLDSRSISIDAANERLSLGEIDFGVLGLALSAEVEPYAYAGAAGPKAKLRVADFSLKELLDTLGIEAPVTADPNALTTLSFEAVAAVGEDALRLESTRLRMDDTTMEGTLAVPLTESGALEFDLRADSITIDNYMAPAAEGAASEEAASDVEIPVELIRALNANGTLRLDEAFLGPVTFTNMQLGVSGADGRVRLNPITAEFFDGAYNGDVRIDASGEAPVLAVDERITGVNLASIAKAMFDVDNITGTIEGRIALGGAGATLSAIAADLDGTMAFELADGAWEGTDVWHEIRSARAIYKRDYPPEPRVPARTEFTAFNASGTVTDGLFESDDLLIQMPFLRVTGAGNLDLGAREVDYSVVARVLERPEFMADASEEELADFTEASIPIRIRGPLASPSFRPDIEAMFRQEVERAIEDKTEELKKDLLDQLLGGQEEGAAGEGADTEEKKDPEDELEDRLKELFPR